MVIFVFFLQKTLTVTLGIIPDPNLSFSLTELKNDRFRDVLPSKMVIVGNIFQLKLGLIETNVSSDENALNFLSFPDKLTFVENQICSLKSLDVRKTVIF